MDKENERDKSEDWTHVSDNQGGGERGEDNWRFE